ncbi:MAG: hypothetical protein SFT94_03875 [Pseudanabaenaceae cyanobacterium bins.68]|nr:hypothetical protein [Pseudanabaenaceae cyanobacterium bins.68]
MLRRRQVKVERRNSSMRSLGWFLGVWWGLSGVAFAQDFAKTQLSAEEVKGILAQIQRANQQRDARGATRFLADFAVSTSEFITSSERLNTQLSGRAEHEQALLGEFVGTKSYNYHSYQVQVQVSPSGGHAIAVENYLLEVETTNRQRVLFAIATRTKFTVLDGRPQILRVNNRVEMEYPLAFRVKIN